MAATIASCNELEVATRHDPAQDILAPNCLGI